MQRRFIGNAIVMGIVLFGARATFAFDVTTCFQAVPPGETGVLQNDLDCGDGAGGPNVTLGRGSRLLLNGYTIAGGWVGIVTGTPEARCTIEGPGEIVGVANGLDGGCAILTTTKTTIKNLTIRDSRCGIERYYNHALTLDNVTIEASELDGIFSTAPSPGNGRIAARGVVITGNGGIGVRAPAKLRVKTSDISGNFIGGIRATGERPAVIRASTLTGNGFGGDIAANVAPKFIDSTCDASQDIDSAGTLGICSND